jgi:hypothetical protein
LCPQAKAAEAKERREAKAEAKNREGSAEKTEKVTFKNRKLNFNIFTPRYGLGN